MAQKEDNLVLTKEDLALLSFISKSNEPIAKTKVHKYSKERFGKSPQRTNDCLSRLRKCLLIKEINGQRKNSKVIKIYNDSEVIVDFVLNWFKK